MTDNIKRDYFWNTLGVFAQNAISPLLLVAITRINGIYDSGLFSFAFSVSIIFWAFGMWGGRTYQVSDVKHEFSNRSYIIVRLILSIFMLFGAVAFSVANHYDTTKSAIIIALVLFKIIESIADAIYGILQTHNHLFIVGKSLFYKAVSGFSLFVIIDIFTGNILWGCLAIVAVNIIFFVFYDLHITSKLENVKIRTNQIDNMIKSAVMIIGRCAPVFAIMFLAMFSLNIPRYFIDMYHPEEIGYFGIIAMPITLMVLLVSFILQPNVVNLSTLYAKNNYFNFKRIVKRIMFATFFIGIFIFIIIFAIGVQALQLIFGVDFSSHWLAVLVIVAGGVVNAVLAVLINILIIMRSLRSQFIVLLFTNIILVFASMVIVPQNGLLGGVWLFAFANVAQVILLAIIYSSVLKGLKNAKEN